jgi:Dolichyl-phosphate-mannose-protein mannosyltransferase
MTAAEKSHGPRTALTCAWPAILLATLVLLPFLNTPFTIDDPLFLQEARHVLDDPLHPQAITVNWTIDLEMRASNLLPGGVAAPYFLVPTVLAGNAEWVAHLTQIALLAVALFGVAMTALRLGLDRQGATVAALLAGSAPAALGMAGTAMPDIAAMAYSVLGMERILAWRDERKWHQGVLAVVWLTLAALTRVHTILLLASAFVFLLDGISAEEIRSSFRAAGARFAPVVVVPLTFFAAMWLTADPEAASDTVEVVQTSKALLAIAANVSAFFAHWFLTAAFTVPWLLLRWRKMSWRIAVFALVGAAVLAQKLGWVTFVAAATALVFADIFRDSIARRDRQQLALGLWLLPALAPVIYVHLPAKYIVPLLPAAAILVARALAEARPAMRRWMPAAFVAAGLIVSILVLTGIRNFARAQRQAAQDLVAPRVAAGEKVWFAGHWGFHWYAEAAGAKPAAWRGEVPQPGDVVVVSRIDNPVFISKWDRWRMLSRTSYSNRGRVMDRQAGAGFFSSGFGYLPWVWTNGESNVFEVWRIE